MSTSTASLHPLLREQLTRPHEVAHEALDDPSASSFLAVTWLATHLAAVARVLHPTAHRLLPHPRTPLHDAISADHALQQALWWLDRRLTGDARVSHHEVEVLERDVLAALPEHVRTEQALLEAMSLPPADQEVLATRLANALRHSPTRPHPGAPVHGPLARVAFRVDAQADQVRDMLDSRGLPTPHDEPRHLVPGRWGSYVIGVPFRRRP